ncbi:acetyltransferase [Xylogone sp. PMI_703]|nr:acetyltransferase [Xylogone sp. PMI_703]
MPPRHFPTKELPLDHWIGNTKSTVVGGLNAVPGFRTSAAFFTFLRANLVLLPSANNSTTSTPLLDPSSSQTLPPVPSSLSIMTSISDFDEPQSNIAATDPASSPADTSKVEPPPLTTGVLTTEADKVAALKLVADSVAQQRQTAASAIIFHPAVLATYVALCAILYKFVWKTNADVGAFVTTWSGLTMGVLVLIRGQTSGYIHLAEAFGWNFARNPDTEEEDIIIGSRYGEQLIGAAILRLERAGGSSAPSTRRKSSYKGGKGVIRAWTVRIRYRRAGVGTELLEEAVRVTREKCGKDAEIGFAAEHANSTMFLPEFFNGVFRRREAMAQKCLQKVIEGGEVSSKSSSRSSPRRRK